MAACIWVLGGDGRNRWAAQALGDREVRTYGVPGMEDAPLPRQFGTLILPFPAFSGSRLRGGAEIGVDAVLERTGKGTRIFGGVLGAWTEQFRSRGAVVTDLYDTEPLTTENAVATAEGAIGLALTHAPVTLHGARCLVIGFGRIGKLLAVRLRGLSAEVTVAARRAADRAMAEGAGLCSDETGEYRHGLYGYDFIFNTVPAPVLSMAQLEQLREDCLLIELASAPGGFSMEKCRALGLQAIAAPGLPGIWAPKTAGERYAAAILHCLEREEVP